MTSDSIDDDRRSGDGAHQGAGRWAQRGASGIGMPPGESAPGTDRTAQPTAEGGDPDISPSLAGGHAGATHRAEN